MPEPSLIKVRTDVVLDVLVPSLHEAALERARGQDDAWLEEMGWHARAIELERFAPARAAMPWLSELLGEASRRATAPDPVAAVSAELAAAEPEGRPEPPDAPSWRVPGPGGHVRYYLAVLAARASGTQQLAAARRSWLTGFFRHCCEEAQGSAQ